MKYRRYFYSYYPTSMMLNHKKTKKPRKSGLQFIEIELLLLLTVSVLNVDSVLHLLTLCD